MTFLSFPNFPTKTFFSPKNCGTGPNGRRSSNHADSQGRERFACPKVEFSEFLTLSDPWRFLNFPTKKFFSPKNCGTGPNGRRSSNDADSQGRERFACPKVEFSEFLTLSDIFELSQFSPRKHFLSEKLRGPVPMDGGAQMMQTRRVESVSRVPKSSFQSF